MAAAKGKKPDLLLKVKSPEGRSGTIGAGWTCEDGSISVKLDACVVLAERDGWMIKLFPAEYVHRPKKGQVVQESPEEPEAPF